MSGPTGRESDKFMLRLPDGMRDRIKAAAEANNRSMNAEIVATLEEKYPADDPTLDEVVSAVLRDGAPRRATLAGHAVIVSRLPDGYGFTFTPADD